jgi:MYXO-CTERM domain-containing protein
MRHAGKLGSGLTVALLLTGLCPAVARASESYPQEIQEALDMPCAPPCTICHETFAGGAGTVSRPFGGAMVGRGLQESDDDCIPKALRALEEGRTGNACRNNANTAGTPDDSDMDGTADIIELRAGDDPNSGSAGASVCVLKYGCGARVVPDHRPAAGIGLLLLGLFAAYRRRSAASPR